MGFSLDSYLGERKKKGQQPLTTQTMTTTPTGGRTGGGSGFSLDGYIRERGIRTGQLQQEDNDFNAWLNDVQSFSQRVSSDYTKRQGTYQAPATFQSYRDKTGSEISDLLKRAYTAKNYYTQYGKTYDEVHGAGSTEKLLGGVKQNIDYLESIRKGLQDEGAWWEQFQDQDAFDTYQRQKEYAEIPQAADFAEKSQYKSTYKPGTEKFNAWSGIYSDTGFGDIDYDYINRDKTARDRQSLADIKSNAALLGLDNSERGEMTDDEIAIFNYIYATRSPEAAYQYIADLTSELNFRQRKSAEEQWSKYASEHPVGSSVFSVLTSPMKGLSYLGQAADYLEDGKIDQNAGYNKFSYIPSAIRSEVAKNTEKYWVDRGHEFAGKSASFLYQTGMSMADFVFNTAVSGGNSNVALAIMGTGAAADATIEAKDRGLSDDQAFALGTIAGIAEIVTEKFSLDALLKGKWEQGALRYIIKNAFTEGTEEVGSDAINLFADILISKDQSKWAQDIAFYKGKGKSDIEAFWRAVGDQALSMGLDFLGGALSGGTLAGGNVAVNTVINQKVGRNFRQSMNDADGLYQAAIDTGLESGADSDAHRLATRYQQKLDKKGTLSDGQLGGLYRAIIADIEAKKSAGKAVDTVATQSPTEDVKSAPAEGDTVAARLEMMRERAQRGFGQSGEVALLDIYDEKMATEIDPAEAYDVFSRAYTAAMTGQEAVGIADAPKTLVEAAKIAAKYDLQAAQGAQQETQVSRSPGFDYNDERTKRFVSALPTDVVERMDAVARAFGLTIRAVDSVFGGQANAQIVGGEILIDEHVGADGVSYVLGHEFTHMIQELAETEYSAFQSALDQGTLQDTAAKITSIYQEKGVEITEAQALDEATADMAGEMLQNGKLLDEFIDRNRGNKTLLQRVREVFRAIIDKLTGAEKRRAQSAEGKLTAALKAAAQNARTMEDVQTEADAGARYSIGYDVNNTPFVTVEDDILEGVPKSEWVKRVKENLREKFPEGVTVGQSTIHIDGQSRKEMTFSRYTRYLMESEPDLYADKLRATNNADEVLQATRNYVNEALAHPRKDNIQDFARGEVQLRVGGRDYTAQVVVAMRSNGKMILYDILQLTPTTIQEKKSGAAITENPSPGADRSTASGFANSISQPGGDVNTNYSLKGTEHAERMVELEKENAALQAKYEQARKQTRRSDAGKVSEAQVGRFAKVLMDHIGVKGDAKALGLKLQTMYDAVASGKDVDGAEFTYKDFRQMANDIAGDLVSRAVLQDNTLYEDYAALRAHIRDTRIVVDAETRANITDYADFRKRNMGRLRLAHGETGNIDLVYNELSREYPGLFDPELSYGQDQLERIAEVMEMVYARKEFNPWAGDMARATQTFANEIMEQFWDLPGQEATFADRQWRQREALKRRHMAEIQDAVRAEREKGKIQERKLKEQFQKKRQEAVDISKRETINRMADRMTKRLLYPTSKQHVPEQLRGPALAVLASLNRESGYELVFGKDAKYKRVLRGEALDSEPTVRTEKMRALRDAIDDLLKDDSYMGVVDPDMMENIREVEGMKDIPLVNMTSGQLTTVGKILCALERAVTSADKAMSQAKYAEISTWANNLREDTKTRREMRHLPKGFLSMDMATPITFFERYGEAGREIYRAMQAAEGKSKVLACEVGEQTRKIVDNKTVQKLQTARHEFELESGKRVTLTTDQIMEVYELLKRQQSHDHILEGGIYQPEIGGLPAGKNKKIYRGTEPLKLTVNDLRNITQTLTPEEIRIADRLQGLMTGMLAEYGNQASMEVYGYRKFTEPDYWPIHVAKEGTYASVEQNRTNTAKSTRNMGMTKATIKHANNPLNIHGVFQTFAQHTSDMIEYSVGLAVMEDAERLFNFTYEDTGKTVKDLLDTVGGTGSQRYWTRLMEDFQNGIKERSDTEVWPMIGGAIGKFKATRVAANFQVSIQQPTAWVKAMLVLNPKHMIEGLAKGATPGKGWAKALKYAPIAVQKDLGGIDMGSRASMKEILFDDKTRLKRANDFLGGGAQAADAFTWGKLWNACEWTIADKEGSPKKGSEAFYKEVGDLFTDVICQTQVVDGIMQRSQIMRSGNAVVQQGTAFMGEPVQAYNILMRTYENWRYEQNGRKRGVARKQFARAAVAVILTNVVTALAKSITGAMRDDDPDKKFGERYMAQLTGIDGDEETMGDKIGAVLLDGNLAGQLNPIGWIPFIKEVESIFEGYDVSRTEFETVKDFIGEAKNFIKAINGDSKSTVQSAMTNLLASGANFFSIPAENIKRDMMSAVRTLAVETDNLELQYEIDKAIYNMGNQGNRSRFTYTLYRAIKAGDKELEEKIIRELKEKGGMEDKDISSAVEKQMKKDQGVKEVKELDERYVAPDDREVYERAIEQLTGSALGKRATEQQLKDAKTDAYKFATRAGGAKDQARWDRWEEAGMDAGMYALYQLAEEMADQPNKNGNLGTITNEEREAAIRSLELSRRDSAAMWVLAGGNEKSNPWG